MNNCCANRARVNLEVRGISSMQAAHGHPGEDLGEREPRVSSTGAGSSLWSACVLTLLSCLGPFSRGAPADAAGDVAVFVGCVL